VLRAPPVALRSGSGQSSMRDADCLGTVSPTPEAHNEQQGQTFRMWAPALTPKTSWPVLYNPANPTQQPPTPLIGQFRP
jgi:hypothetical protein